MTKIYHKHNEQSKYKLCIFKNQTIPWAVIYNDNGNGLYMFRPFKMFGKTIATDIAIIKKANQFMQKNKLPLFDINKHHIEDANNQYYITQNIEDTIDDTKNS